MTDESKQRLVTTSDERRHKPEGTSLWWGESYGFDFATHTADGQVLAAFTRILLYPRQQKCWFWAGIVGDNRSYVLCRDHELDMPSSSVLELRGGSLWTHLICETPLEHWTVAMEAYALAFDDPFEAWRSEHGDRIGLAFDLEWESPSTAGIFTPSAHVHSIRYDIACEVNGILQMGEDEWTIAATGWRHHEWGVLDWSTIAPYQHTHGLDANGTKILKQAPLKIETANGPSRQLLFTLKKNPLDSSLGWIETLS